MLKSNSMQKKISYEVRNTGKHDFRKFAMLLLLLLLFEEAKLTNHSTYEPEILHVNQFSSELVHRYIICSLTLLLLLK